MATFEEKILAYLDGSLPSEDREDVLGAVHSSPEQRALFEAHLRLEEIYSLVAKPTPAPLALQRELASKVPVLAVKLPYLATERERRNTAAVGFLENASSWLRSLKASTLNAVLIIALALLAGGVWYLSGNHNAPVSGNGGSANSGSGANGGNAVNGGSATNGAGVTNGGGFSGGPSGNAPQNIAPNTSGQYSTKEAAGGNRVGHSSHWSPKSTGATGGLGTTTTFGTNRTTRTATQNNAGSPESHATKNLSENASNNNGSAKSNELPELPPLVLRSVEMAQSGPATVHTAKAIPIGSTMSGNTSSFTPVKFFAVDEYRYSPIKPQADPSNYARNVTGSQWNNSVQTQAVEVGADYEIDPWFAVGLRGGVESFVEAHDISHTESFAGYPLLTRTINEAVLLSLQKPWTCVAATYSPMPANKFSYSFTAGAGAAFVTNIAPMVRGEAALHYQLSDAFALRAAASYEADWISAINETNINANGSSPSANGVTVNSSVTGRSMMQAFGISLGLSLRP